MSSNVTWWRGGVFLKSVIYCLNGHSHQWRQTFFQVEAGPRVSLASAASNVFANDRSARWRHWPSTNKVWFALSALPATLNSGIDENYKRSDFLSLLSRPIVTSQYDAANACIFKANWGKPRLFLITKVKMPCNTFLLGNFLLKLKAHVSNKFKQCVAT